MRAVSNQERVIMARVRFLNYLNRLHDIRNEIVAPEKSQIIDKCRSRFIPDSRVWANFMLQYSNVDISIETTILKKRIFSFKHFCSCTSIRLIFSCFHHRAALAATACFCLIPLLQFKGLKGSHLAQLAGPYQRPAWPALAGCRGQLK